MVSANTTSDTGYSEVPIADDLGVTSVARSVIPGIGRVVPGAMCLATARTGMRLAARARAKMSVKVEDSFFASLISIASCPDVGPAADDAPWCQIGNGANCLAPRGTSDESNYLRLCRSQRVTCHTRQRAPLQQRHLADEATTATTMTTTSQIKNKKL